MMRGKLIQIVKCVLGRPYEMLRLRLWQKGCFYAYLQWKYWTACL